MGDLEAVRPIYESKEPRQTRPKAAATLPAYAARTRRSGGGGRGTSVRVNVCYCSSPRRRLLAVLTQGQPLCPLLGGKEGDECRSHAESAAQALPPAQVCDDVPDFAFGTLDVHTPMMPRRRPIGLRSPCETTTFRRKRLQRKSSGADAGHPRPLELRLGCLRLRQEALIKVDGDVASWPTSPFGVASNLTHHAGRKLRRILSASAGSSGLRR